MKKNLYKLAVLFLFMFIACNKVADKYEVPVDYYKLDNGLKVVLSQDHTTPIVTVAVYYNIGFRIVSRL